MRVTVGSADPAGKEQQVDGPIHRNAARNVDVRAIPEKAGVQGDERDWPRCLPNATKIFLEPLCRRLSSASRELSTRTLARVLAGWKAQGNKSPLTKTSSTAASSAKLKCRQQTRAQIASGRGGAEGDACDGSEVGVPPFLVWCVSGKPVRRSDRSRSCAGASQG